MADYESLYRDFRWEVPAHFNFGDQIDWHAADPRRVAILWEDQQGRRARLTFADIRAQSNRVANVLAGSGVARGDPVMLVLPRVTLWQAAYIGALKAGALVIPCSSMLREKDLAYRANHCGARAIIASHECVTMISDLKNQCPALKHFFIAGSSRTGWASLQESKGRLRHLRSSQNAIKRTGDLLLHVRHHQGTQGGTSQSWVHLGASVHRQLLARLAPGRSALDNV